MPTKNDPTYSAFDRSALVDLLAAIDRLSDAAIKSECQLHSCDISVTDDSGEPAYATVRWADGEPRIAIASDADDCPDF